jgi:O-antigen/teichoic acid export membrane protein
VVLSQGAAGVGALIAAIWLARRAGLARPVATRAGLLDLAKGGTPLAVFYVAISVQPYLDAIVLSKLVPGEVVGWFGAARNIMGVLVAPAGILGAASFPELSRSASDIPALRSSIRRALRPLLALGALAAVGTYLFADFAVGLLYGRGRFDPAIGILQLFSASLFLLFADFLFGTTVTAVGRSRDVALVKVANVALSTGLSLVLIPWFQLHHGNGGEGLVVAFGLAEVVMLAAYVWLLPRGALELALLGDVAKAAAAGLVTLGLFLWLPPVSPWIALPACVILFGAMTLATGLFRVAEFRRLGTIWRREAPVESAELEEARATGERGGP